LSGALVAGVLIATGARAEAQRHPVAPTTVPAIVARAIPAVVSITTRQIERDQFNRPISTRGLGSGFIFDRRGYVLTNHHVVADADQHGIGFAISIDTAKPVVRELIARGRVVRPALGLVGVSLTPQIAYANDLPIERGVLVLRVDADGPAEAAGLEPGDVIVMLGTSPVKNLHHFHEALARHRIGETVEVSLWREGQTLARSAVLAEYR